MPRTVSRSVLHCCLRVVALSSFILAGIGHEQRNVSVTAAAPGLVAAYNFDQASGTTLKDFSGSGNDGVVSGAVWSTTAKHGGALSFDGINDRVNIPDKASLDLSSGMTIEAWVRPTAVNGNWRTVVLKERPSGLAYALYATDGASRPPAGYVSFGAGDVGTAATQTLALNAWTHLATTFDGATLRIFVNGQPAGSRAAAGAIVVSSSPLRIGGNVVWGEYFAGQIDDVRIYNRALTATEIQADMITPVTSGPDQTPPTVAITSPSTGATVSAVTPLTAGASDNVGVGSVQFLLDGVPLGAADTTSPYSLDWDTRTATNGEHFISARAVDAAGNATTAAAVRVIVNNPVAPPPDFTLDVTPSSRTVSQTGSTTYDVDVAYLNGFSSQSVSLTTTGLPAGATSSFAFNPMPHQGRTAMTIATNSVAPGSYPFTVVAAAEGLTRTRSATLLVSTTADFSVLVSPSAQNTVPGGSTSFEISVTTTNGFADPVSLSVAGLPAATTASFSINPVTPPGTATLTLRTGASTPAAQYQLTITATGAGLARTTAATLVVNSLTATWSVATIGATGEPNNSVRVGAVRVDGLNRVYVGTIATGRMLEYGWNGSSWTGIDVGGSPAGKEIHNFNIGDGRGDGQPRIYAASTDANVYEIWHTATGWRQLTVATLDQQAMHTAVGDGRGDGVARLYAVSIQSLYEFTWTGTNWVGGRIGGVPGAHGIAVGAVRGPGQPSLFIASISLGTFEARWNGAWVIANMGDSGDARDVDFGVGRNDGVNRVYSALLDGRTREFSWNGSNWTFAHLPTVSAPSIHAYVFPGRNDGINRVYVSTGNGKVFEYTWSGSSWSLFNMGGGSDYMYGLHFGAGRNDGITRVYSADRGSVNRVYEYTWTEPAPSDSTPPSATGGLTGIGETGRARLSWNEASDNVGVVVYNVHHSTAPGLVPSAANRVGQTAATAFLHNAAAGLHYYVVTAQDAAGNVGPPSSEIAVNVLGDTTAPTVAMTAPASGAVVSGIVSLAASASDDVAVAGVGFLADGSSLGAEDTQAPYSFSWDTRTVANGTYAIAARARDATGNAAVSDGILVTVDNVAGPTGLVAAYGFNEGTGVVASDASGSGNSGAIANATWAAAGKFGAALSFNGASTSVTVNDSPTLDLTSGMTLEAWVNPSSVTADWRTVILKERPAGLAYALYATDGASRPPAGYVNFGSGDFGTAAPSVLPLNVWTHLAATFDGATLRLYLNGQLVSSRTAGGGITTSASPLRIGGNAVWGEWFAGTIDEVRIYNRALSAQEIQHDMNTPVGGS